MYVWSCTVMSLSPSWINRTSPSTAPPPEGYHTLEVAPTGQDSGSEDEIEDLSQCDRPLPSGLSYSAYAPVSTADDGAQYNEDRRSNAPGPARRMVGEETLPGGRANERFPSILSLSSYSSVSLAGDEADEREPCSPSVREGRLKPTLHRVVTEV